MDQKFTLVSGWNTDQRNNSKCFSDELYYYLYEANRRDSQGKKYLLTVDLSCGGTWITDERAEALIEKHGDLR